MIIKCISKIAKELPESTPVSLDNFENKIKYDVEVNKYYVVYGMTISSKYIHYYLNDPSRIYYPWEYPGFLFEVVDGRFSKYWNFTSVYDSWTMQHRTLWMYPEWVEDRFHYGRLIDKYEQDVQVFKKYQFLMNLEFPNPSVELSAEALDEEWLFCKDCIDAWQSTTDDGMVICPKCKKMMHNPRHTSILNIS